MVNFLHRIYGKVNIKTNDHTVNSFWRGVNPPFWGILITSYLMRSQKNYSFYSRSTILMIPNFLFEKEKENIASIG